MTQGPPWSSGQDHQPLTRDQRRSLRLNAAVAAQVAEDPERALRIARENLRRMQEVHRRGGQAARSLAAWQVLLDGPLDGVLGALSSTSQVGRDLRQNSPFAGVLSQAERREALTRFIEEDAERRMSPLRRRPGTPDGWEYTAPRPAGWSALHWLLVRGADRVFHQLAYGRFRVPGLAAVELRQPFRGWCDATSGISPPMRARLDQVTGEPG